MSAATDVAAEIGELAANQNLAVAVAESLTGGSISSHLAAAPGASGWYAGAVVSYETRIKYDVLGVPAGHPVVTKEAATTMVEGIVDLMTASAAVAVTGAGGPEPQEGQPPGTVWIAVDVRGTITTELHHFEGSPSAIVDQTVLRALEVLRDRLS